MIVFERPVALWLLLSPFVLYVLRSWWRRRHGLLVASLPLWERALEKLGASSRWSIWRDRLRDLALLLTLCCLAATFGEPRLVLPVPAPTTYAIVIDASASMAAQEAGGRSRWELARDRVRQLLDERGPRERFQLVLAGDAPAIVTPLDSTRSRIERELMQRKPGLGGASLAAAIRAVRPSTDPSRRVLLISDFSSEEGRRLGVDPPSGVFTYPIGIRSSNLAIEATHWPGDLGAEDRVEVQVTNYDRSSAADARIVFRWNGANLREITARVPAGERRSIEEAFDLGGDGELTAQVYSEGDGLEVDDTAYLSITGREAVPVLWVPPAVPDFEMAALMEVLGASLFDIEVADEAADSWRSSTERIIVAESLDISRPLPKGRYLIFDGSGLRSPLLQRGEGRAGPITTWNPSHPVTRGLLFEDAAIRSSSPLLLDEHAVSLLETADGSVAAALEVSDLKLVWVGFRPDASTWPSSDSFPLFVVQAARWLAGSPSRSVPGVHTMEPVPLDPAAGDRPGTENELPRLMAPGFGNLPDAEEELGVTFVNSDESRIAPGGREALRPPPERITERESLVPWLIACALFFLLLVALL